MAISFGSKAVAAVCLAAASAIFGTARAHAEPPQPSAQPYSPPWQLRPVVAANVLRSDTAFARYEDAAANGGFTVVSILHASYRVPRSARSGDKWAGLAPLLRLVAVNDSPPSGPGGFAIVNPLVGALYAMPLTSRVRAGFFLAVTIPIGMGGGDAPDKGQVSARLAGQYARSQMDNSVFAVNDFAVIPGVDAAWVQAGFTVQVEATLFQLWRVRGAQAQHEASKTNFTCGLHGGYFVVPLISVGVDLRYQRWFNAPIAVDHDPTDTLVDNFTLAIGPRLHLSAGETVKIRPGIAYARGLDRPMAGAANYHLVQLDVPLSF
jgi:hypothetical protein